MEGVDEKLEITPQELLIETLQQVILPKTNENEW